MSSKDPISGEASVALAALVHLIRLMGAELVAGQHRDNVEMLVRAIETKLKSVPLPKSLPEQDTDAGMVLAHRLLVPIFDDLRDRSEKARLRDRLLAVPTSRIIQ